MKSKGLDVPPTGKQETSWTRSRKPQPACEAPAHFLSISSCGAGRGPRRSRGPPKGRDGAGSPRKPRQLESAGGSTGEESVLERSAEREERASGRENRRDGHKESCPELTQGCGECLVRWAVRTTSPHWGGVPVGSCHSKMGQN